MLGFLDGYKTIIAALGLLGLAVYQSSQGQWDAAFQSLMAALAAFGLRKAIARQDENIKHLSRR